MKKIIITTLLITLFSASAFAIGNRHGHDRHKLTFIIKKHLDLSKEQQAAIEQLTAGKHQNMHTLRKRMLQQMIALDPDAADYRVQLEALADAQAQTFKRALIKKGLLRKKIHALLDENQKIKLKKVTAQLMEKHGKKHSHL